MPIFVRDYSTGGRSPLEVLSNVLTSPRSPLDNAGSKKGVQILVIIDKPALFVEQFFDKIEGLSYPKDLISVVLVCRNPKYSELAKDVQDKWSKMYKSVTSRDTIKEALEVSDKESEYTFFLRTTAYLDNPDVLNDLIKANVLIAAPLLRTYDTDNMPWRTLAFDMGWNNTGDVIFPLPKVFLDSQMKDDLPTHFPRLNQMQNFNVYLEGRAGFDPSIVNFVIPFLLTRTSAAGRNLCVDVYFLVKIIQ